MIKKLLFCFIFSFFINTVSYGQCGQINNNSCTSAAPTTIGTNVTCTTLPNQGGRRNFRVNNMIAGATYSVSNCTSGIDTQMTIRNIAGTIVGYNDDDGPSCATTSASIDFTPSSTGSYRIQLNKYGNGNGCATNPNSSNGDIVVTLVSNPYNPCTTITNIASCDINTTSNFSAGIGAVAGACTFLADGQENVYTFTPTVTANHSIQQLSSTNYVDYYYKAVSVGCSSTGWTCTGAELNGAATGGSFALTANIPYYIMLDPEFTTGGSAVFNIVCPPTPSLYCTPTTDTPDEEYITNVSFLGTLQDTSNSSTFTNGYEDYTGLPTISSQIEGEGINVYVEGLYGGRIKAWIDWDNDGNFDDNPLTELVYDSNLLTFSTTFGFQIPLGTTPGDYRIRIRTFIGYDYYFGGYYSNYNFNACEDFYYHPVSYDYEDYGEAEDYLFNVQPRCVAEITSVIDGETCGIGSANLIANGTGTSYNWYASANLSDTAVLSTSNTYTPTISSTTTYYVTAVDSGTSCESIRIPVVAKYNPVPTLSVTPDTTNRIICGENNALEITAIGDVDEVYLIDEDFSVNLGVFTNQTLTGNSSSNLASEWQLENSLFLPNEQVWFPAISSGFGSNGFVMSNSDVGNTTHQALHSSSVITTDFNNLTLSMRMYYSHYTLDGSFPNFDYVAIEVSENNGAWTSVTGNLTSTPALVLDTLGGNIVGDVGIGTLFETLEFDLSPHINITDLRIRIRYYGEFQDGIAVDNIKLFGDKDITAVDWSTTPANIIDLYIDTDADNIGDTLYTAGQYTTVYAIPNLTQLEQASYSFTINAALANSCGNASLPFNVTNNTKVFQGTPTDANWNLASNWLPNGIPTLDNCVVIKDNGTNLDPILGPPFPPVPGGLAKNFTIKNNGYLDLAPGTSLTVKDWVDVETGGTFNIRDGASLIQITNVSTNNNSGSVNMEREVTLNPSDYIYWASPVEGFDVSDISSGASQIFEWQSTIGTNLNGYGNWTNASGNMALGKGYIIRGLAGTSNPNTALFSNRPNNGIITIPITRGSYSGPNYVGAGNTLATEDDDNWNLIGNPYPSAISADAFINQNATFLSDTPNPPIEGTVYLWRHLSAPVSATDPFYADYVYNYNANDYIAFNSTGSNPAGFDGFIAAGQAFFVLMDDNTPNATETIEFNNTMRNETYNNSQFYRSTETNVIERHRIWLDLIQSTNKSASTLVGYIEGATNDIDRLFDAKKLIGSDLNLYSMTENKTMSIQGRVLPFIDTDTIDLGFEIPIDGSFTIAINALDGLFSSTEQSIYLEDTYTNIVHDLQITPYTFSSANGTFNDRFILRYTNETLGVHELNNNPGITIVAPKGDYIKVTSKNEAINTITVYDLLGRVFIDKKELNTLEFTINEMSSISDGTYIVTATLLNGKQKTQKVILKD
jgi:hypothetical protein